MNQTFTDFELLVIDDGSSDETWNWLSSLFDERILIFRNEGSERSSARNTGLKSAAGKYICFIDDDDLISECYLHDFYNAISVNPQTDLTIYRTGFSYIQDQGKKKLSAMYNTNQYANPVVFCLKEFCGCWSLCIPALLAKSETFDIRWPHWQDTHYIVRLFLKEGKLIQLPNYNYEYRIHDAMGSKNIFGDEVILDRLALNIGAMDDLLTKERFRLSKFVDLSIFDDMKAIKYLEYATSNMVYGQGKHSWRIFKKSIKTKVSFSFYKYYIIWFYNFVKTKTMINLKNNSKGH